MKITRITKRIIVVVLSVVIMITAAVLPQGILLKAWARSTCCYYFLAPNDWFDTGISKDNMGTYCAIQSNASLNYWGSTSMKYVPDVGANVFLKKCTDYDGKLMFHTQIPDKNDSSIQSEWSVETEIHGYNSSFPCPYNSSITSDSFENWIYVLNLNDFTYDEDEQSRTYNGAWFTLDDYKNYDDYYGSYGIVEEDDDDTGSDNGYFGSSTDEDNPKPTVSDSDKMDTSSDPDSDTDAVGDPTEKSFTYKGNLHEGDYIIADIAFTDIKSNSGKQAVLASFWYDFLINEESASYENKTTENSPSWVENYWVYDDLYYIYRSLDSSRCRNEYYDLSSDKRVPIKIYYKMLKDTDSFTLTVQCKHLYLFDDNSYNDRYDNELYEVENGAQRINISLSVIPATPEKVKTDFEYRFAESSAGEGGGVTITKYKGSDAEVTIPEYIDGLPVTSIGSYAFSGCKRLKKITMPDSVVDLGGWDFDYIFSDCIQLEEIHLSNNIGGYLEGTFSGCKSLKKVNIPERCTNIGEETFVGCKSLLSLYIPPSVKRINDFAFDYEDSSLSTVTGMEGLENIGGLRYTPWYKNLSENWSIVGKGLLIKAKLHSGVNTIPSNVRVVESYSIEFPSGGKVELNVPDTVEKFNDNLGCYQNESLTLRVYGKNTTFEGAPYNANKMKVECKRDSEAELYAIEYDIPFSYLTDDAELKTKTVYGDLDGDGDITANDALMILRASVGMETLTPEQIALADVDGDGDITANDALAVLRYSVGMGDGGNVGKEIA